jgi:hypothetical protein
MNPIVIEKFYKWEWDYECKHCGNPINERGIGCFWTTESHKPMSKRFSKYVGAGIENGQLVFDDRNFMFSSDEEREYIKGILREHYSNERSD